jgi:aryl-alcohol dehydrogenase-like predicted oxidoreductase/predicted kinase
MRLSTDADRDEARAEATIAAAAAAGVTVFDTARAYGHGELELGHNERLLARALRGCGAAERARIVTKGGMARPGGGWVPDGRAKALRADCEASLDALDGLAIDLYLLHAPDPRTPWLTSVRALARLADAGLVQRVGLSNVNRAQLDEAVEHAPIAAVEVGLSPFDVSAIRGGIVERCAELGIAVIAHSPFGGPRRTGRLARSAPLAAIADAHDVSAAEVALAWLLRLSPALVAIPGATRPETAASSARAATLELSDDEHATLSEALVGQRAERRRPRRAGEVVLIMGIPGAGKSRLAQSYLERGYDRLNRDERGGSLRDIADALERELAAGCNGLVLDNTYLTRAARSYVVDAAARHGVSARCVWLDTPLSQAQVNLVARLVERFDRLPTPAEIKAVARAEPGLLMPTSQMRAARELEPPSPDEGWASVERVAFERVHAPGAAAVLVAAGAASADALAASDPDAPHLVYGWDPDGDDDELRAAAALVSAHARTTVTAFCPHPAGPPTCWCRPPLPGLPLAFARAYGIDLSHSTLIGNGPAHRTLATTLGARYIAL